MALAVVLVAGVAELDGFVDEGEGAFAGLLLIALACGLACFEQGKGAGIAGYEELAHVAGHAGYEVTGVEAFVENVVEEEEALADLVGEEVVCEAEVVFGREYVEALADFLVGEVAVGEGCHLVEDGEGVAHASVGFFGYELEGFVVGCVAFAVGYVAEVGDGVVEGHAVEVVDLTA